MPSMATTLITPDAFARRTLRPISDAERATVHAGASLAVDPATTSLIDRVGIARVVVALRADGTWRIALFHR
jgi:hypothetical protein